MHATVKNDAGVIKDIKAGFSWTTLIFGFFVPLIRGDVKWAAIMFVTELVVGIFTFTIGNWVVSFIFAFIYNKLYTQELLAKGFYPADEVEREKLISRGYIS